MDAQTWIGKGEVSEGKLSRRRATENWRHTRTRAGSKSTYDGVGVPKRASGARGADFVAVVLDMQLGRFRRMMHGVLMMAARRVRMVGGGLVVTSLMVSGGFAMMPGGMLVMFRCLVMMLGCVLGHGDLQRAWDCCARRARYA